MDAPRTRARDLGVPGLGRGRSQLALIAVTDFTVWLGSGAIMPYLPVFLREQAHASLTLIALIAAAYFVGVFALSGWFGHLSDRVGRRPMIIAGTVLYAVATALFLTTTDPVWFIVFRFVEGAGTAAVVPAAQAFIADITVDGNRGRAYGWLTSAQFCGLIAGPALAWPLYALGGGHGRWAFSAIFVFGAALTAAVAVVLAVLLREPRRATGADAARTAQHPARLPLRALLTQPVVAIVVVVATAEFSIGAWEVVWSLWLRRIGAPMRVIGLTWIAFSLPMAFSFAGGRLADRSNRYALMVAGFAILALSYVPFALTHDVRVYLVAMLVGGAAFAVGYPAKQGFLVRVAAPGRLGAVQGVEQTAMQLAALVGTLTAPPLYGLIGGDIFALAGVVSLAGLAVAVPMLRREWACVAEAGVDGVRSCADLRRFGGQGGLATGLSAEVD
jgi:DHA1 family multidrug resistance protein-like MFS transporter